MADDNINKTKKENSWWCISLLIMLVFVGYRSLTGSSITRDAAHSIKNTGSPSQRTQDASTKKKKTEKQIWLDYYDTGECHSRLKKKWETDAALQRMAREIGPDLEKAIKPTIDKFCLCISAGMADGSKITEVMAMCKPGIQQGIKRELYGMGYDSYD